MYVQVFTYRYTVHLQLYNNLHVNYTSFPRWNYRYMLIFWCFSTCLAVFQTKFVCMQMFLQYTNQWDNLATEVHVVYSLHGCIKCEKCVSYKKNYAFNYIWRRMKMRSEKEIDAAKIYHRKSYEEESFIIFLLY